MNKNRIFAIVLRHLYVWPRGLERFMWSVGWPLLELIIWGLTTSYLYNNALMTFSITTVILGGIIFWSFVSRSQLETAIALLDEVWNKNIINIFSTPLTMAEFLAATIILGIIKFIISATLLITIAYIFYGFNIFIFGWHLPFMLFNLILFGWTVGFFTTGCILRFGRRIEEVAWSFVYFLQPLVGVFYPVSALPSWIQKISNILPLTYLFEEMRRFIIYHEVYLPNLTLSFILNIFYLFASMYFVYSMYEKGRESGRLTKLEG